MDFRGSSQEFAVVKEPKQIGSQVTRNFRASKEKRKLYCKLIGNSRLGLTLLAAKLEASVPQASVPQVCHFGNMPSFHSTEHIDGTEY